MNYKTNIVDNPFQLTFLRFLFLLRKKTYPPFASLTAPHASHGLVMPSLRSVILFILSTACSCSSRAIHCYKASLCNLASPDAARS